MRAANWAHETENQLMQMEDRLAKLEEQVRALLRISQSPLGCIGHCAPELQGPSEHEPYTERESNP